MNPYTLSPEAMKAWQEGQLRQAVQSMKCKHCGHQRRQHGRAKCFGGMTPCKCRKFEAEEEKQ